MGDTKTPEQDGGRSVGARIGITALNLLTPGLGLLRLERPRQALFWWLLGAVPFVVMTLIWAISPVLDFAELMVCIAVIAVAGLAALLGSIAASWRWSKFPAPAARPVWSRWYAILLVVIASDVVAKLLVGGAHASYKPFYIPSEAMMPTLLKNDRLVASMRPPETLRRGDIILFKVGNATYIKRLAAIPGDRIAMVDGKVVLNGQVVPQQAVGVDQVGIVPWEPTATRLREHFPGEDGDHFIYDSGPSPEDNYTEIRVPPGNVFVLGDNRDDSADSRVPREEEGVALLPISDIRGIALFYTWGPSHKSGRRIH